MYVFIYSTIIGDICCPLWCSTGPDSACPHQMGLGIPSHYVFSKERQDSSEWSVFRGRSRHTVQFAGVGAAGGSQGTAGAILYSYH